MVMNFLFIVSSVGNSIPISQVRDDVVAAFRKDVEWQTSEKLHPYKMLCTRLKVNRHQKSGKSPKIKSLIVQNYTQVQVEVVQLESDDIVEAIAHEVSKLNIIKLVIGASSWSIFSR